MLQNVLWCTKERNAGTPLCPQEQCSQPGAQRVRTAQRNPIPEQLGLGQTGQSRKPPMPLIYWKNSLRVTLTWDPWTGGWTAGRGRPSSVSPSGPEAGQGGATRLRGPGAGSPKLAPLCPSFQGLSLCFLFCRTVASNSAVGFTEMQMIIVLISHLCGTYCRPGAILNALHVLMHSVSQQPCQVQLLASPLYSWSAEKFCNLLSFTNWRGAAPALQTPSAGPALRIPGSHCLLGSNSPSLKLLNRKTEDIWEGDIKNLFQLESLFPWN